jgi:arylsulfatase A-like enzyme
VVFDRAISPAPFTLTAHASMFTGRYPQDLSIDWTVPLDQHNPTLAEILYAHGYMTAGFVSNTSSCGLQTGLGRGFVHYEAHRLAFVEGLFRASLPRRVSDLPNSYKFEATEINESFFRFLANRNKRPFFAFLNYLDCHAPYFPDGPFARPRADYSKHDKIRLLQWTGTSFVDPQADGLEFAREAYEASLVELDRNIGALQEKLEKLGEWERTLVIIVGDHGEQFGEHGLVQHADSLYRPVLHVPLIIIDPRKSPTNQRVHEMVTLRDLPATILELLGVPNSKIPGDSFASLVTMEPKQPTPPSKPLFAFIGRGPNFPEWHPNSKGPVEAIFTDGKYYIKSPQQEELYDFDNDPHEQRNLAQNEASGPLLEQYRELLSKRTGPDR